MASFSDELEIYGDLQEPLERVGPAVLASVHQYMDGLEIADPQPSGSGCSLTSLQQLAAASSEPYSRISQGRLPRTAPSLKVLSRECREGEFSRWFDLVLDDPMVGHRAAQILPGHQDELQRTFTEGDTRGFLKAVASPLVPPLVD